MIALCKWGVEMKHKIVKNMRAFTLIELMVTVAIVAILAAIAYPSYTEYVMKGRRADAKAGLLSLQMAQEKYRANCTQYATAINASAASYSCTSSNHTLTNATTSPDGYYSLSVVSVPGANTSPSVPDSYRIRATRVSGGLQANDKCGDFEIDTSYPSQKGVINAASGYDAAMCW